MSRRSLFKFWGLVIAIAIAFIACHNLQFPSKIANPATVTVKLSGWGGSPIEEKLLKGVMVSK